MDSDRLTQLEQRLAQVETELATAHRLIDVLRQGTGRPRRFTGALLAGSLIAILAITGGTATAAPGPQPLTVKTPFIVQNQAGQVIFRVGERSDGSGIAKVFDADGKALVALQANESGGSGELAVNGVTSGQLALLSTSAGAMTLRFYRGSNLQTGIGEDGNGGIVQVNSKAGKIMAKVSNNGTSGTVGIYNAAGETKALLGTDTTSGYGEFDLFYADGTTPAAKLSEATRGGYFVLTNRQGIQRIAAGTLPSDQGTLQAFGPGGFDYVRGMK